ncbi:methyltransferase domain-containing protein [Celerinatantimonas yamalensis]|uniref:Class I SAM-dependent methyltransferase n=1 Tax=Celerinatantimonas yamalensis TaxID=559956 RepID=A0ABW9GBP0_9GAMM
MSNNTLPLDYQPAGEPGKNHSRRVNSGIIERYLAGNTVLDIGGGQGPAVTPWATIMDLATPDYDGEHLPYADGVVDAVFSSHCLEHVTDPIATLQEWYRVLKLGGFMVISVPHHHLYERKAVLPSHWNHDHKRFYTPASLLADIEQALTINSYRIRELRDVDDGYDYAITPDQHAKGCYEIEVIIEKITPPWWHDIFYQRLIHQLTEIGSEKIAICGAGEMGDEIAEVLICAGVSPTLFTDKHPVTGIKNINGTRIPVVGVHMALANGVRHFVIASDKYAKAIQMDLEQAAAVIGVAIQIYSMRDTAN